MSDIRNKIDNLVKDPTCPINYAADITDDATFIMYIEACLYFKVYDRIEAVIDDTRLQTTKMMLCILRYGPLNLFKQITAEYISKNSVVPYTDFDMPELVVQIAGTYIDFDEKIEWLCEYISDNSEHGLVHVLNEAIRDRDHNYNKITYRKKITNVALKCMSEYDMTEMIRHNKYTLLCANIIDTQTVDVAYNLMKIAISIYAYENYAAILNKIHDKLSNEQILSILECILQRGDVRMFSKFQKRYKQNKMSEITCLVEIPQRKEYLKLLAINGYTALFNEIKQYWIRFIDNYADYDVLVFNAAYHGHIDFLDALRVGYSSTDKLQKFYSIVADSGIKAACRKTLLYVKANCPNKLQENAAIKILQRDIDVKMKDTNPFVQKKVLQTKKSFTVPTGRADIDFNWRDKN